MKSLRSIIAAALLSASLLSPTKTFSEKEVIFDEIYPVEMSSEYGDKTMEEFRIKASLDSEKNTLYLETYTQNYNRKNWIGDKKIALPIPNRHTNINYNFSRIFLLRPLRIKIEEMEQRAYTVPAYKWSSSLEPYEERESVQLMVETGETVVDKLFSAIPFLDKLYEKYIKNAKEKEEEYYDKIFEEIEEDYARTRIFPYIPEKLIGQTETAREYVIEFDTGNTQDIIPMYIWLKFMLGDPSNAAHGSFPNKSGKLENVLIKFNLNEDKVRREELYAYFFHGDELEHLNQSKEDVEGTNSNPAVITVRSLGWIERQKYEEDKILRVGKAKYVLEGIGDSVEKDLFLKVLQFETLKDREDYMKRQAGELAYPSFFKESILSSITNPTIVDVLNPLEMYNEKQLSFYFDLILDYSKRTEMEILISENKKENEEVLKAIKEQQMNSEE